MNDTKINQWLDSCPDEKAREFLLATRHELLTQDNRATQDPIFLVQQERRTYGVEEDCADDTAWIHTEGFEADADQSRELNIAHNDDRVPDEWTFTGFIDTWHTVQTFLTEKAAQRYIDGNGHNLNNPRIYADGLFRNWEMIELRRIIMMKGESSK